jgi:predicted DNA-binding protein
MSDSQPTAHIKGVPIHLPPEMVQRIDAIKDPLVPRAAFVKDLIDKALRSLEGKS